jgi:hypothetical protein
LGEIIQRINKLQGRRRCPVGIQVQRAAARASISV